MIIRAPPAMTKGSCCDPFVVWLIKCKYKLAFPEPRHNDGFDENTEFVNNGRLTKTANLAKFDQIELI